MALLGPMGDQGVYRQKLDFFQGYNHNLRVGAGEWYDTGNLTSAYLPVLATRPARARVRGFSRCNGLFAHNGLYFVDGTRLYWRGQVVGQVLDCPKQFAAMGGRVVIWPDKVMFDEQSGEISGLGARFSGNATFLPARLDGGNVGLIHVGKLPPDPAGAGAYWLDTSGEQQVMRIYSADTGVWNQVATPYVRIYLYGLEKSIKRGDAVRITGTTNPYFNLGGETRVVADVGESWIAVPGMVDQAGNEQVVVERVVPDMDFIVQSGNRLWGCSSQNHQIYASKLGDPTNWNCFAGLSTDSYAATVGSEGAFTGAAAHLGYVLFFKEHCLHKVFGTRPANFQIVDSQVRGVAPGASATVATVNETLYYLSTQGVCAYDGGLPAFIGDALGRAPIVAGAAGALGGRYVLSAQDGEGWRLLVYDERLGLWIKEDGTHALAFARDGGALYFVDDGGALWAMGEGADPRYADDSAAPEGELAWHAQSGMLGMDSPDKGYVGRVQLRLANAGPVRVLISRDGGPWRAAGVLPPGPLRAASVDVGLRRADYFSIMLAGVGACQVHALALVREPGTERG